MKPIVKRILRRKFEAWNKSKLRKALEFRGWVKVDVSAYWVRRGASESRRWGKGSLFRSMRNAARREGLLK